MIITVGSGLEIKTDSVYLGMQGEESSVTVKIDSSLVVSGQSAFVDFFLPNGEVVTKGGYDYSADIEIPIGVSDNILKYDGKVKISVRLATDISNIAQTKETISRVSSSIIADTGYKPSSIPLCTTPDGLLVWEHTIALNNIPSYNSVYDIETLDLIRRFPASGFGLLKNPYSILASDHNYIFARDTDTTNLSCMNNCFQEQKRYGLGATFRSLTHFGYYFYLLHQVDYGTFETQEIYRMSVATGGIDKYFVNPFLDERFYRIIADGFYLYIYSWDITRDTTKIHKLNKSTFAYIAGNEYNGVGDSLADHVWFDMHDNFLYLFTWESMPVRYRLHKINCTDLTDESRVFDHYVIKNGTPSLIMANNYMYGQFQSYTVSGWYWLKIDYETLEIVEATQLPAKIFDITYYNEAYYDRGENEYVFYYEPEETNIVKANIDDLSIVARSTTKDTRKSYFFVR